MIHKQQLDGKNQTLVLEKKLSLKELELTSLLEVTQAINANLPEKDLYKIFHFTLIANLHIPKLALFVLDKEWNCKVNYNTKQNFLSATLCDEIKEVKKISLWNNQNEQFNEFNIVVPISHKSNVLAYVLVGGIENAEAYLNTATISFIQTLASIIIVAIENKKLVRKELQQEALRKELEIARDVQSMLFPKKLPSTERIKIQATYLPHQSIGGDYYDCITLDKDNHIVCIGDVSGKGVPAALLMSNVQACLRTLIRQKTDLKEIIQELNYCILNNAKGERFITFFIAFCDLKNKTLRYINAGHNPSFIVAQDGSITMLEKGSTVLGAFSKLPFIEESTISYASGSLLFAYTDGITETANNVDEEFGIDRVKELIKNAPKNDLAAMHDKLKTTLEEFKEDQNFADDITYISCMLS